MGLETGTFIDDLVVTNPLGTDDRSSADDHMRLLKSVLKNSFPQVDGAINATVTELNLLVGLLASASEINTMDGITASTAELNVMDGISGKASSDNIMDNFPAGTLMTFQQTASPTGYTKQTTHNDKAFRVVSGTAGSAGTSPFTTVFGLQATAAHTLTEAQMPSHDHSLTLEPKHGNNGSASGVRGWGADGQSGSVNAFTQDATGGGGSHTHNIEMRVQYVDLIIASKN